MRPSSASFDQIIRAAADRAGLDDRLVKAVVEAESGFNPRAVSKAGAKGLMQLMDGTARSLGVKDPFDPAANVEGGAKFLRSLLDRFGSLPLALAAYNAGPDAVERYGGVPPFQETRSYVERVLSLQRRNQLAVANGSEEGGSDARRTLG
jgi:soluble lytic murein transglycosylase-like protein